MRRASANLPYAGAGQIRKPRRRATSGRGDGKLRQLIGDRDPYGSRCCVQLRFDDPNVGTLLDELRGQTDR